jgi:catechol 2,3-dioxygenase-like lactoylglutathione lyase family enzyme
MRNVTSVATRRRRRLSSRTSLTLALLTALLAAFTAARGQGIARQQGRSDAAAVTAVVSIGTTVSDMDRAIAFYRDVLTFAKESDAELYGPEIEQLLGVFGSRVRVVTLRLGAERLRLTEYLTPRGRPIPPEARSNDQSFQHVAIVVSDMQRAYARLRAFHVTHASTAPQRLPDWNKNAGGIEAFYFKDPDNHTLEVIHFPNDKGAERWHGARDSLFLGIDHTAIVSSNTDASLAFYRDLLGLSVAGESENSGTEQEHLNNVFGAHLRITALRAASGPGIELLEYLAPRDGRPVPADERGNDLAHWETDLAVGDAVAASRELQRAHVVFISSGPTTLANLALGFRRATIVRDPDGHALAFTEQVTSPAPMPAGDRR